MQVLIAQIINGLSLGSIYVLLVTGFNLLLLVAMIIHFAYPQVVVFPCTSPGLYCSSRETISFSGPGGVDHQSCST